MKTGFISGTVFLYVVTILTGGTSWYAAKLQLSGVAPVISLIYRFGAASTLLLLLAGITGKRLRYSWSQHAAMAMLGGFGFSVAFLLIYKAAAMITTGLIALTYSAVVLLNVVNTRIFLKTPITRPVMAGILLGLAGMALVFLPELPAGSWSWLGFAYALAATLAFSFANISAVQLQGSGVEVLPLTGISMAYGALFLLGYAVWTEQSFTFDMSPSYAISLIYLTLFPSIIGYTTYFAILGRLGAERGAYTMLFVPLVALAISSITEGYRPTLLAIIGTLMILAGNYCVIVNKFKAARPQAGSSSAE